MTKRCVCGRSKEYPVCDGTHKIKETIAEPKYESENSLDAMGREKFWEDLGRP